MVSSSRKKITISVGLSPYVIENIGKALQDEKYAGQSDLISIALIEHFAKEDVKRRDEKMVETYQSMLQSEKGKKILSAMKVSEYDKIEALKKKGIACVELGDLEEAMKCFAKAKELETGQPSKQRPGRINRNPQNEQEDCLTKLCPNPRELTPEEKRKAAVAKEKIKALLPEEGDKEEVEEEFILE